MRRCAKAKRAQQMTKHFFLVFFAHTERGKHFLLQFGFVNTNAAAADLNAV